MKGWNSLAGRADQLGESPFWHPDEGMLYWVDIPARLVHRAAHLGQRESWAMPSEPGCIAPARGGGLVIALRDGIYRARQWAGPLELLAPAEHDPETTRFNDGKADALGRFWAGTIYEPRDQRKAALYCLEGASPLCLKLDGAITANGLAWSPDAATLYWASTPDHVVHAWDWEPQGNSLTGKRVLHQFQGKPAGWQPGQPGYGGRPDGAAVDSQGNYWCAMFEGARLLKFSPAGVLLDEIGLPVRCPTMPCFGGDDLRTLYLTSASYNRSGEELAELPLSGHVLSMRVEVPGLPVNFFRD